MTDDSRELVGRYPHEAGGEVAVYVETLTTRAGSAVCSRVWRVLSVYSDDGQELGSWRFGLHGKDTYSQRHAAKRDAQWCVDAGVARARNHMPHMEAK